MADRIYVVESYWAADYVGYQADAEALLTNDYYIDDGYYVDDFYAGKNGSSATLVCDATKFTTTEFPATTLSSEFTTTAESNRVLEFTVTCDSLFSPTLDVNAVRNTFAVLDSTTEIAVTANKLVPLQATIAAEFTQTSFEDRLRETSVTASATFTFDATTNIILGGATIEATGDWSTSASVAALLSVNQYAASSISSQATISVSADRFAGVTLTAESAFSQATENNRIRYNDVLVDSAFTQTSLPGRIQEASVSITGAFSPSMTANAITNTFAVLDTTSALAIGAIANRSASVTLSSIINQSAQGMRLRGYAMDVTATISLTANNTRTRNNSIQASSEFTLDVTPLRIKKSAVALDSDFTQTTDNTRTRDVASSHASEFTVSANINEVVQLDATLSSNATLSTIIGSIKQFESNELSLFTPSFQVNAVTNTFAVLDSVATVTADVYITPRVTATLSSASALTVTALRIKDFKTTDGYYVQGLEFTPTSATYPTLGDPWINISSAVPLSGSYIIPYSTNRFLLSFWAKNPNGALLKTEIDDYYLDYGLDAGVTFINGDLQYVGLSRDYIYNQYRSTATYGVNANDGLWNHYLIYHNDFTVPKVYKNGQLISASSTSGVQEGYEIPLYYGGYSANRGAVINWSLGYDAQGYENPNGYQIQDNSSSKPFTGSIGQVAFWYSNPTSAYLPATNTVPNVQDTAVRQRIFNEGLVDLGSDGTLSGLRTPDIYLRLSTYNDIDNLGASPFTINTAWKYISGNTTPISEYGNKTYFSISSYTPTIADQASTPLPFRADFTLTAGTRASNNGFVDLYAVSTVAATAIRVKQFTAALSDNASQVTVDAYRIKQLQASISSQASLTADATTTIEASAQLSSAFTSLVAVNETTKLEASLAAEFTLSADNVRTRDESADIAAQATVTVDPLRIKQLEANLQVEGFEVVAGARTGRTFVDMTSAFTITATGVTGIDNEALLYADTDLTATAEKTARISQTLNTVIQVTVQGDKVRNNDVDINSEFTLQVDVKKTTRYDANLTVQSSANIITDNSKIVRTGPATFTSNFTLTPVGEIVKPFNASLQATITSTTSAIKTVRPQLVFDSIAVELVAGKVISYDKNLMIHVRPENRQFLIVQEPTTLEVKNEYRQIEILEERPILPVHSETRVNMVRTTI